MKVLDVEFAQKHNNKHKPGELNRLRLKIILKAYY